MTFSPVAHRYIDDSVLSVVRRPDGAFLISFSGASEEILAAKLVICTGAYTNFLPWLTDLLPEPDLQLDLDAVTQTVAYVEVPKNVLEDSELMSMPSLSVCYEDGLLDGAYILPPIK